MEIRISRQLLICLVALGTASAFAAGLAWSAKSATGLVAAVGGGFGVLVMALSWFQARLREREAAEQCEFEEIQRRQPEARLFSGKDDTFPARVARMTFERWVVPMVTLLLGVSQAVVAWSLWRWLGRSESIRLDQTTIVMALFGLIALVAFLLGRFAAGLAQPEANRLLRPAAAQLLLAAALFGTSVASGAVAWFGYPNLDRQVARGLVVLLGLLTAEAGILLLLEIYRPRHRSGPVRLLYESRILGLLTQPGGLVSTVAQTLDYQFGFKVSETWFYRWLEQALAWLVLLQAAVLWGASAVVIVEPHEQATIERFGRRTVERGVLLPGLHFKWPWPVESVRIFSAREARSFNVGFVPDPKREGERTLVWTRPHYLEEFNLLVASREAGIEGSGGEGGDPETTVPVNLLTASIPVQYHITNVLDWGYRHAEPAVLLERLATREVAHYLVSVDAEAIMSTGRLEAARELREAIQRRAIAERLGVEILFVGLQDIHPPVQAASAYEAVIGATQQRETTILEAQAYRAERVPLAEAEAVKRVREAGSFRTLQTAKAVGTAGMFTNQIAAFEASPEVYARRAYLETIVQGTASARKYLLTTTNLTEDYWVNLEDKLRPDLLDVTLPPPRGETKKP